MTQVRRAAAQRLSPVAESLPSGRLEVVCGSVRAHKCRYCSSSPPLLAQVYRKVGQRRRRGRNAAQGNGRAGGAGGRGGGAGAGGGGGGGAGGRGDARIEEKEEKAFSEELEEEEPARKGGYSDILIWDGGKKVYL